MSEQEKCGSCGDLEVECVCDDGLRRRFELPPKIDLRSAGEVARSVARAVFGVELPEGTEVLPWVSDTPFTVVGVRAVGGAGQIEVRVRYPREVLRRAMPVSAEEARALERIEVDAAERAEERQKAWEEGARYSVAAAEGEERPTDVQGFIVALAAVVKAAGLEPDRRPSKLIAQVGAALAAARALRAPVDVEGEANKIAGAILDAYRHEGSFGAAIDTVRPHVERAARLAREAEGLREELASRASLTWVARAREQDERIENLTLANKIGNDALAAARAEIDRLKGAVEHTNFVGEQLCETVDREPVTRLEEKLKKALDGVAEVLGAPAGLSVEALPAFAKGRLLRALRGGR